MAALDRKTRSKFRITTHPLFLNTPEAEEPAIVKLDKSEFNVSLEVLFGNGFLPEQKALGLAGGSNATITTIIDRINQQSSAIIGSDLLRYIPHIGVILKTIDQESTVSKYIAQMFAHADLFTEIKQKVQSYACEDLDMHVMGNTLIPFHQLGIPIVQINGLTNEVYGIAPDPEHTGLLIELFKNKGKLPVTQRQNIANVERLIHYLNTIYFKNTKEPFLIFAEGTIHINPSVIEGAKKIKAQKPPWLDSIDALVPEIGSAYEYQDKARIDRISEILFRRFYLSFCSSALFAIKEDPEAAADVAQDALMKIHLAFAEGKFRDWGNPQLVGFCNAIFRNHLVDYLRKRKTYDRLVAKIGDNLQSTRTPEEIYLAREHYLPLLEIIQTFEGRRADVWHLFLEGLQPRYIAAMLDLSVKTVTTEIRGGKALIERHLNRAARNK